MLEVAARERMRSATSIPMGKDKEGEREDRNFEGVSGPEGVELLSEGVSSIREKGYRYRLLCRSRRKTEEGGKTNSARESSPVDSPKSSVRRSFFFLRVSVKWDSSPMRKPAGEREWHHAARSSCVTTGSKLSGHSHSGVAGVAGDGDLEQAVVDEEDMGGK